MYEKRLMLISDDLDIDRDMLREIFENEFDILEAVNGQECLRMVKQYGTRISIILLDIQMPVATGLDVLKYRNTNPVFCSIPVVVITANDDTRSQMEVFQLGATDFITKPFIPDIIEYRIRNVLSTCKVEEMVKEIVMEKENLKLQSEMDLMTGIYNKVTAERLIAGRMANNDKYNALMVVDIDDFKQVNDTQGHLTGDRTICAIAELLSRFFRKTDIVGRIGGDEFIVCMLDIPSKDLARQKADHLTKMLKYQSDVNLPVRVTVSIGLSISEPRPYTYEDLFREADEALYIAKRNGKGQYAEFGKANEHLTPSEGILTALLVSKNREVCSAISTISRDIHLLTVAAPVEVEHYKKEFSAHIQFLYVDISKEADNGDSILRQMRSVSWLQNVPLAAICSEGNMGQYATAIQNGAADIIPSPIDVIFAGRRTEKLYVLSMKKTPLA